MGVNKATAKLFAVADTPQKMAALGVEGLARRVTWTQSGPLDLSLFIPYQLTVTPAGS